MLTTGSAYFTMQSGRDTLDKEALTMKMIRPNVSALLGLIFLALPVYFVFASLLKHNALELGPLAHPVILLGALFMALALNSLSVMSFAVKGDGTPVLGISFSLRLRNIAVMGLGLAILATLLGYAFIENFVPRSIP